MVLFFKILEVGKAIPKSKQTDVLVSMGRHHGLFEEGRIVSHVGVLPIPARVGLHATCWNHGASSPANPRSSAQGVHVGCTSHLCTCL